MKINIKLDPDFSYELTKLKSIYGSDMAKINGLADEQLDYTDFIDNFIDTKVVADASVDANANVNQKSVVTLLNEMAKPHQKLLSFNKIFYELKKKYGADFATQWLDDEWEGKLYLHDAHHASFEHYCIYPTECCEYILNGKRIYASMEQLYSLLEEEEHYDGEVIYKEPKNLLVADYDTNNKQFRYTRVWCVSKKPTSNSIWYTRGLNNFDVLTTEDHTIITANGERQAKDLTSEDNLYCISNNQLFDNSIYEYNGLELTKELGWLVGFYLAEGYNSRGQLVICQSQTKNPELYNAVIEVCNYFGIPYNLNIKDRIQLKNGEYNWERKLLTIIKGKLSYEKRLCPDFIHFNDEFLKGILGGIIDGDGTITTNDTCLIRMSSRTLINQLKAIGLHFGVYFGGNRPYINNREGSFVQKKPIYSASVNMNQNREFFKDLFSLKIAKSYSNYEYNPKFNTSCIFQQGEVPVKISEQTYQQYEEVYDLTTESHTFLCNDILVHNCWASSLQDLAEKGLYFIENFNYEPAKHLSTFVDFVKEFISFCANSSSGAVGLPDLLVYMYYFWDRDVQQGYYTETPEKYAKQQIQRFIYSVNQPFLRGNIQAAFTNSSVFDHPYLEALFGGMQFPDGKYMIDEMEGIMNFQKLFLTTMHEIRHKNVMTYPVNTISLLKDKEGNFVDKEFAEWACRENMEWCDSNFFIDDSVTSLSSCCRLSNNVKDLYMNSIGGTALKVGSEKVCTINLARIAYEVKGDKEKYYTILRERTQTCLKVLDTVRNIIRRNIEKGLMKNFDVGIVELDKLYSTIGIIGIYEALSKFGYVIKDEFGYVTYTEEGVQFAENILHIIHEVKDEFKQDHDYMINVEAVPAESAAAKLMKKDQYFFPNEKYELPLYANQWIPLGVRTSIENKIKVSARIDEACTGGSISHINLDSPFQNFDVAWDLLCELSKQGIKYFAFCTRISACKHNHGFYGEVCPICGEPKITTYQRIVGFITPVNSYSKERKAEFYKRDWMSLEEKNENENCESCTRGFH